MPQAGFQAPVVDEVHIRVLVDSARERFMPRCTHDHVRIDHVGAIPGRQMTSLACEWGLSLHLASRADGETSQYLVDFGYTPEILLRNVDLPGADPGRINGLILSRAHHDHFGGLAGFVTQHRTRMRDDLSLFLGGEEAFREEWIGPREAPYSWGALDRITLSAQNLCPVCCPDAQALDGHAFTTG